MAVRPPEERPPGGAPATDAPGDVGARPPWPGPPGGDDDVAGEGPLLSRTFRSLRHAEFRYLWIGSLLAMGAMQTQTFARGFFVYDLTGDPILLGVVSAANGVPGLVFGLFGGVFVDRLEKRRIIQVSQVLLGIMALVVGLLIFSGSITWVHLMVAAVIHGSIMPFMMPARQAVVPQIVPRALIMNAAALTGLAMSVTTMVAPVIAGPVASWIGIDMLYFFITVMYFGAVVFTSMMQKHHAVAERSGRSPIGDIILGFQYIRRDTVIMLLLIMGVVQVMMMAPIRFVMPLFAKDVFNTGPDGLGYLLGCIGLGSMFGALVVASMKRRGHRGRLLAASGVLSGLVLLAFAALSEFIPVFWAALVIMVMIGLVQSARMTLQNSLTLEYVDPGYRGRVMSIQGLTWGLMPIGVLPLTIIADYWGAPAGLAILALAFMVISASVLILSPKMRALQ